MAVCCVLRHVRRLAKRSLPGPGRRGGRGSGHVRRLAPLPPQTRAFSLSQPLPRRRGKLFNRIGAVSYELPDPAEPDVKVLVGKQVA